MQLIFKINEFLNKYIFNNLFYIFFSLVVFILLFKLWFVTRSPEFIIYNVTVDDAYYYFEIAKNIVLGHGSTFDLIAPTNGYHPLWMLILLPIYYLFGSASDTLPVQMAVLISFVLELSAIFVMYKILEKIFVNRTIQIFFIFLWLINPYNFFNTITGLETPLILLTSLLFIYKLLDINKNWNKKYFIWLGVLAGLMMLSRTDYFFLAGAPIIFFLIQSFKDINVFKEKITYIFYYFISATIVVSPWLIWNWLTFKTIVQVSGIAFSKVQFQLVDFANPGYNPILLFVKAAYGNMAEFIPELISYTGAGYLYLVTLSFFLGAYFILKSKSKEEGLGELKNSQNKNTFLIISIIIFCYLILFTFHAGVRFAPRIWYFVPFVSLIPLFLGYFLITFLHTNNYFDIKKISTKIYLLIFMFFVLNNSLWIYWKEFPFPIRGESHTAFLKEAEWINKTVKDNEKVVVLNSGIVGYFTKPQVVNIDGLVNNVAYEYIKKQDLYNYIKNDIKADYLVDFDRAIFFKFMNTWGVNMRENLTEIERIYGEDDDIRIKTSAWKIK